MVDHSYALTCRTVVEGALHWYMDGPCDGYAGSLEPYFEFRASGGSNNSTNSRERTDGLVALAPGRNRGIRKEVGGRFRRKR
jgi:hypothetical protein